MRKLFLLLLLIPTIAFAQTAREKQLEEQLKQSNAQLVLAIQKIDSLTQRLEVTTAQLEESNDTLILALKRIEDDDIEIASLRKEIERLVGATASTSYFSGYIFPSYSTNGLGFGSAFSIRIGKTPLNIIIGGDITIKDINIMGFAGIGFNF